MMLWFKGFCKKQNCLCARPSQLLCYGGWKGAYNEILTKQSQTFNYLIKNEIASFVTARRILAKTFFF
jgi:hypothetical protein